MSKDDKPATPDPVRVAIAGRTYELRCSRHARKALDAALGGIRPATAAVRDYNCTSLAILIAAGAGLSPTQDELDDIADAIWEANDPAIVSAVTEWVVRMSRGGRPAPAADAPPPEGQPGNG